MSRLLHFNSALLSLALFPSPFFKNFNCQLRTWAAPQERLWSQNWLQGRYVKNEASDTGRLLSV